MTSTRARLLIALCSVAAAPAPSPLVQAVGEAPEFIVRAEPFKRFDHTRWRIDSQIGVPYPAVLYAPYNEELQFVACDLRFVLACDLDGPGSRDRQDVLCVVEDAAVSAAPWVRDPLHGQSVLDQTDDILTGQRLTLQVSADGRVLDVGLLDEPQTNQRINRMYENSRQLLLRALSGFHMRVPGQYAVGEEWFERNSRLMVLPVFRYVQGMTPMAEDDLGLELLRGGLSGAAGDFGGPGRGPTPGLPDLAYKAPGESLRDASLSGLGGHPMALAMGPTGYGRSVMVHRMDRYKGTYVVQSTGTGIVDMGGDVPMMFDGDVSSVAVYDPTLGYMTERRWVLQMDPTASSPLAFGPAGWPYWQLGSIQWLEQDEMSEVGRNALVSPPQFNRGQLPPWPAM